MKNFSGFITEAVFLIIVLAISAIAHERDIYLQCKEYGNSNGAMWTAKINCTAMEEK